MRGGELSGVVDPSHCVNTSNATGFTATWRVPYEAGELKALHYEKPPPAAVGGSPSTVAFQTAGPPKRLVLSADKTKLESSRDDLAYITATIVDANGVRVQCGAYNESPSSMIARTARLRMPFTSETKDPLADPIDWLNPQRFAYTGIGIGSEASSRTTPAWCGAIDVFVAVMSDHAELVAVGTGDPTDVSSLYGPKRSYRGRVTAIVRPGKTGSGGKVTAGKVTVTASALGMEGATMEIEVGDECGEL